MQTVFETLAFVSAVGVFVLVVVIVIHSLPFLLGEAWTLCLFLFLAVAALPRTIVRGFMRAGSQLVRLLKPGEGSGQAAARRDA